MSLLTFVVSNITFLQLSRIDLLRSLWKRVQEYAAEDPEVTGPSHQRHIDKVGSHGRGHLVSIMPVCVCPKGKEMGSFAASSEGN